MTVSDILWMIIEINALVVIIILIFGERDPSTTLAWAFALLLAPVVGLIAYLLFGQDWRRIGRTDRLRLDAAERGRAAVEPIYERFGEDLPPHEDSALARRLATSITQQCGTRLLPCEDLEIFAEGGRKFDRLLADIDAARSSIHLQYFIWESDELTQRICDRLARKVAEGVEVRVLYDWLGSLPYQKAQLTRLRSAGAQVRSDRPHLRWLNYRDHRKLAIIDGRIGYTGGMNAGQEYVDGGTRFKTWRDTHCRFAGPLVAELQRSFAIRWFRLTREDLFGAAYFPVPEPVGERTVWAQLVSSGPGSEWQAVRNAFLLCITGAEKELRIQSPYFVPDDAIMQSLIAQSLAGVDVRFMMAGVPDKKGAWYAAFTYIDDLIRSGGRTFQYMAGFFHPKTIVVDGWLAVIGTANFDIRSFELHDEISLFFYDTTVASQLKAIFDHDAEACREIDASFYERLSPLGRFRNALFRLWSRLL